nr:hypothetical protein [Tanacetum cinerariifolium]
GVPDVPKDLFESETESWGDSGDDDSNDDDNAEVTKDVDNDDVDNDADDENEASDIKDDKHVILTTVHDTQKTEVPFQSLFVSSDFENQFLNLDNVLPTDTKLVSMMNIKILPKEVSHYTTLVIQICITTSCENIDLAKCSSQPKSTYEAAASLTEIELKKILFDKIQKSKSYRGAQERKYLYDALVKSNKLDKYLFESYGKVYSLKRDREDKDKYEDPSVGYDQGLKKQKTSTNDEPSRRSKSKESKSSSSKGSKSQPKASRKSAQQRNQCLRL